MIAVDNSPKMVEFGSKLAKKHGFKNLEYRLGDIEAPPIANRDIPYFVRQLNDIQNGARTGSAAQLMRQVVAKLTWDDMISLAAYAGSLQP